MIYLEIYVNEGSKIAKPAFKNSKENQFTLQDILQVYIFLTCLMGKGTILCPMWILVTVLPNSSWMYLFPVSDSFLPCLCLSVFSWIAKEEASKTGGILFLCVPSLLYSGLWILTTSSLLFVTLFLLLKESTKLYLSFFFFSLALHPENSEASTLDGFLTSSSSPFIREHYSTLPAVYWLKNDCFCCLFVFQKGR